MRNDDEILHRVQTGGKANFYAVDHESKPTVISDNMSIVVNADARSVCDIANLLVVKLVVIVYKAHDSS